MARISHLQIYLVGGAVRDTLLGLPVKEKDWVVVGATPEEMIAQGFNPVGKDFPVFLHPKTHEEYALARTERKVEKGYKGFTFHAATDVTLEEDLKRRDLTINAMAQTPAGEIIDPYNGQADLKNKILRHVSPAFQEDPVRILRLARFSTKFPDFNIHPDTLTLMKNMVNAGEVNALVPERVWQELSRALSNTQPIRFFEVLENCGALPILFPQINIASNGMDALKYATELSESDVIRFAALLHDLPEHDIETLCRHYRIPNDYIDLAVLVSRQGSKFEKMQDAKAEDVLNFILAIDALRRPKRFNNFLMTLRAVKPNFNSATEEKIQKAIKAIKGVDIKPLQDKNLKGEDFAHALKKLRIEAIS